MNEKLRAELKRELIARGFDESLRAPNGSVWFDDDYLRATEIAELLETMVSKRDKALSSVEVLGRENTKDIYDDVAAVVDAAKSVITRMSLRDGID